MKQFIKPQKQSKLILYIFLLLGAVAVMWMLRRCSTPSPYESVAQHPSGGDTIDVAIEYSPLSVYRYADTLGGFNYDMIRAMAVDEGLVFKFHPLTALPEALRGLDNGLYDMVVADIAGSADFRERYAFTVPVYLDKQVLVQPRNDSCRISSALQLAHKEVWVAANASVVSRLHNLASEIGDSIIVHQDSIYGSEQLLIMVATGDIPLAVVNESIARQMSADYPQIDASTDVSFTQFQPWLLRKDDIELTARIDSAIIRFQRTPMFHELMHRYF